MAISANSRNTCIRIITHKAILKILCSYGIALLVVWFINAGRIYFSGDSSLHTREVTYIDAKLPEMEDIRQGHYKLILFWNKFFQEEDFRFGFGHKPFIWYECPVHTCYTTSDKAMFDEADAVLMHGPVVKPLPPMNREKQLYVYAQGEPHRELSADLLSDLNGYINLTMTYRADSDMRLPYGLVRYDRKLKQRHQNAQPPRKSHSIVWLVSHCETPSKREEYVEELKKYIDVDIYGGCGTKECNKKTTSNNRKSSTECMLEFEDKYRFILAFENDFCKDYASEKLFRALHYDMVPIVYGGANFTLDAPPHSVINVLDYDSPKQLAKYLHHLDNSPDEYNEYLSWKKAGFEVERDRRAVMGSAMCKLCEVLHDPNYTYKDYPDIKHWWLTGSCHKNIMDRMKQRW